MHCFNVKN